MTRNEAFDYLYDKLVACNNWYDVRKIISECIDINSKYGFEIFMCEGDENTVYIEDDYVQFDF